MYTQRRLITQQAEPSQPRFIFKHTKAWDGIRVQHTRLRSGEMSKRWNAEHYIVITLDGSFISELHSATGKNRTGPAIVGQTSILPAGQPYSARWDDEIEHISLFLEPRLLERAAADSLLTGRVVLTENCSAQDALIRQIGQALAREAASERPAGRLYAESLANILAVYLLRNYSVAGHKLREPAGGLSGRRLRLATEFIADNLSRDLALAEIADAVDLSPYHFTRAFKQAAGLTPHQFLIRSRIERAKALLVDTQLPIVEIGLRVGFKSQSHFTTIFRRFTGLTPKSYRDVSGR
ncbi:MAG TPA: AraC family transcriptional regulator [Blastocatellia bacterium]|nr:AraC family transcriptional regulator [Blastocatellia bacterium]